MTAPSFNFTLRRLVKPDAQTLAARSVEYFGWYDFILGFVILIAPLWAASLFHIPKPIPLDANYLRLVGTLVVSLGMLYTISGRLNSDGFVVASLLDRPLVPVIMTVLWFKGILPGPLAIAFSISDFGGFLWTAFAWRSDIRRGLHVGGPDLTGQSYAARSAELFGWLSVAIGFMTLVLPAFIASLLKISSNQLQGPNYLQLVGLLVGGLGMLFVVGGTLNAHGFVFASLPVRLILPIVVFLLWWRFQLSGTLTLLFVVISLAGLIWTLAAWHIDVHFSADSAQNRHPSPLIAQGISAFFAFIGGVLRNARVFHPDGSVFLGTVRSLEPEDTRLALVANQLVGPVLMRVGMGLMKKRMPEWIAAHIADAPSVASRFFALPESENKSPNDIQHGTILPGDIPLQCRPMKDLDLLCTAGGDRLWKLVWNLATGGKKYGLRRFDYLGNVYYADVPYRILGTGLCVWIRLVQSPGSPVQMESYNENSADLASQERQLKEMCARNSLLQIEVQPTAPAGEAFIPVAEIRFDREIEIDQEALHFDPFAGRGLEPYGFLTGLRRSVYPASVQSRPHNHEQRGENQHHLWHRFANYWKEISVAPIQGGSAAMTTPPKLEELPRRPRRWVKVVSLAALIIIVALGLYLVERFTRNSPLDYADEVTFFERGSTGGERMDGIPYWIWVTLPKIFPEYLPDKNPDHGYASFGMIYETHDKDNPYALPLGMSRRNVSGLDVVYLNCAACHTGTVRQTPTSEPRWIPGMPAHQFNLGAWGTFLTTIPKDQKFSPQRILDQIDAMQDDPRRLVPKPDWIDRLIIKYYAVALMRDKLITLGQRLSFIDNKTWGPGRVDTFNAPKALLNFPMDKASDKERMGNADFPSVWNQQARKGMHLHWDGNNTSVDERNLSAAFGTGAYPPILDTDRVLRMAKYLETAQPPEYPYGTNKELAAKGQPIYEQYCVRCHGTRKPPFRSYPLSDEKKLLCDYKAKGAECVGTVVPIEEIKTDRSRYDSYTWLLAVNQSTLYAGYEEDWGFNKPYPQRFQHFQKTPGYASMPLDGIWLRAPYLHNGSVPSLADLLKPSESKNPNQARPIFFYRGYDVYDAQNVGFISTVAAENGRDFFAFDTSKPGNHNYGHEGADYGTELNDENKRALLEYLKTF